MPAAARRPGVRSSCFAIAPDGGTPDSVTRTRTNDDGRTDGPLVAEGELVPGLYELVFDVGAYFEAQGVAEGEHPFLGRVPVRFGSGRRARRATTCRCSSRPGRTAPTVAADPMARGSGCWCGLQRGERPAHAPLRHPRPRRCRRAGLRLDASGRHGRSPRRDRQRHRAHRGAERRRARAAARLAPRHGARRRALRRRARRARRRSPSVERLATAARRLPFALEVVAFADEEGSRFGTAFLGSSVLAGSFDAG